MDDFDLDFHGSTKKIISLVKNLPEADGKKIGHAFHHSDSKGDSKGERKQKTRRFNKHPRKLSDKDSEELLVIKQPSRHPILTDSSDEYCDVTIRREEFEHLQDDDHILRSLRDSGFKLTGKHVKDLEDEGVLRGLRESAILKDLDDDLAKIPRSSHVKNFEDDREAVEKISDKNVKELENWEKKADDSGGERRAEKEVREPRLKEEAKICIDLKLEGLVNKSLQTLDDIRILIESGIDPPDGSEDFCRRKKRAAEFGIRFSRIHLYQLNRLSGDIENILKPGPATNRNSNLVLNQKFYMAHQTLYQAFQAYLKHLPTSIIIGLPDKLREVLHHACNLCDIYKKHSDFNAQGDGQDDFIVNYENKCRALLEEIDLKVSIRPSASQSHTNLSVLGYRRVRQGKINKFSMYHSVPVRADVYWRKAIASIAQKKFDVPSRYRTATYKHRPPPPPPPPPQPQVAEKPHRRSCHKRCSDKKISNPQSPNDIDKVTTLMEQQVEKQPSKLWTLAQSFFHKISKDNQTMSQGEYECILEHFIGMLKGGKTEAKALPSEHKDEAVQQIIEEKLGAPLDKMEFGEFVQKLLHCVNNKNTASTEERMYVEDLPEEVVKSTENNKSTRQRSKERRQTLTVTGAKNAQLICIKNEESLIEDSEDEKPQDKTESSGAEGRNKLIYRERSEGEFQSKLTRVGGKQGLIPLGMLPKDTIVRIIEYKLQFHKEKKNECMYKKSGNMSPWILVERISEELLEEMLQSITRDIQVDEILRKIYAHEFK